MSANVPTSDAGTTTLGISMARASRREHEHHSHDQHHRQEQSAFDVVH